MSELAEWDLLGDKEEYENWLRRQNGEEAPAAAVDDAVQDDSTQESESRVLELPDDVQEIIETDPSLADVLRTTFVQKALERCADASEIVFAVSPALFHLLTDRGTVFRTGTSSPPSSTCSRERLWRMGRLRATRSGNRMGSPSLDGASSSTYAGVFRHIKPCSTFACMHGGMIVARIHLPTISSTAKPENRALHEKMNEVKDPHALEKWERQKQIWNRVEANLSTLSGAAPGS